MRNSNTNLQGNSFSESVKDQVWQKGRIDLSKDQKGNTYRRDVCGALIRYDQYGQQTTYGWEIDHIKPVSKGGTDNIDNLQPLQWSNNRNKADQYPAYPNTYCVVKQ